MTTQDTVNMFFWITAAVTRTMRYCSAVDSLWFPFTLHYVGQDDYGLLHRVGSLVPYMSLTSPETGTAIF